MTVDLTCVVSRLFEQVDTKLPDLAAGPMQRDVATYTDPQRFARDSTGSSASTPSVSATPQSCPNPAITRPSKSPGYR
jgi:hypothetical protein